jgi:hypothetical protein
MNFEHLESPLCEFQSLSLESIRKSLFIWKGNLTGQPGRTVLTHWFNRARPTAQCGPALFETGLRPHRLRLAWPTRSISSARAYASFRPRAVADRERWVPTAPAATSTCTNCPPGVHVLPMRSLDTCFCSRNIEGRSQAPFRPVSSLPRASLRLSWPPLMHRTATPECLSTCAMGVPSLLGLPPGSSPRYLLRIQVIAQR